MNSRAEQSAVGAAACPLCGRPNDCRLCTTAAYKGPCWCESVSIPEELLARVPAELRNKACICRECVMEFHRARERENVGPRLRPGDFYFDNGLMVFTGVYHLRRGWCCDSGCRHCPYRQARRPSCDTDCAAEKSE
ncbi:MAG TPA: cysteine-rich CWC family protein [Verrucomicrobiota bacterium]|nr:cysteine-rich CWC family protein [Verrucomicrobiota bacterium]